jgi:hypothetical protein
MERDKIKTPPKSRIDDVLKATLAEIRGQVAAVAGNADE